MWRTRRAVVTVVVLTVGVAACAPGPGAPADPAGGASLRAAVAATLAIERGRFELVQRVTGPEFSGEGSGEARRVLMTRRAAFDRPARRLSLELVLGDVAADAYATGAGDEEEAGEAVDEAGRGGALPIRTIVDGDTTYTQFGVAARAYGVEPHRWYRGSLAAVRSVDPGNSVVATLAEPLRMVRDLAAVPDDVKVVGEDRVRGVPTTHLSTTLPLEAADDLLPERGPEPVGVRNLPAGRRSLAVDVWLDEAERIRRLQVVLELNAGDEPARLLTTLEVFDVEEAFVPEPPPPAEVVDGSVVG